MGRNMDKFLGDVGSILNWRKLFVLFFIYEHKVSVIYEPNLSVFVCV